MSDYKGLKYITRGNTSPQGKPRVYFCCCPQDFERYRPAVFKNILDVQVNAAIWYYDPSEGIKDDENFWFDLETMQLFVVPVSSDFLFKENHARTKELAFALDHQIPVLPLMMEPDLDRAFNSICGEIQFLYPDEAFKDPTAVPYREKLIRFLGSVLMNEQETARIRKAFNSSIFLSYRKKDRREALKVMRAIHAGGWFELTAIWYDEFLTPGEEYNDEIEKALQECDYFFLVVTPSLLEKPNYVMTVEYPAAVKLNKTIVPVEAVPTDRKKLETLFKGIGTPIPLEEFHLHAPDLAREFPGLQLPPEESDYLHGLACLFGIGMAKDPEYGIECIEFAAKQGYEEAYERLISMYYNGSGVKRDYGRSIEWQKRYIAFLSDQAKKDENRDTLIKLLHQLNELFGHAEWQGDSPSMETALNQIQEYTEALRKYDSLKAEESERTIRFGRAQIFRQKGSLHEAAELYNALYHEFRKTKEKADLYNASVCADHCAQISLHTGKYRDAEIWYARELDIAEDLAEGTDNQILRHAPATAYIGLGDVYDAQEKGEAAKQMYRKALDIVLPQALEFKALPVYRTLADIYARMGDIWYKQHNVQEACKWYYQFAAVVNDLVSQANAVSDRRLKFNCNLRAVQVAQDPAQKRQILEESMAIAQALFNDTHQMIDYDLLAKASGFMGDLFLDQKNSSGAKNRYLQANQIYREMASTVNAIDIQTNLGVSYLKLGRAEKDRKLKKEYLNQSLAIMRQLYQKTGTAWYRNTIDMIEKELKSIPFSFFH